MPAVAVPMKPAAQLHSAGFVAPPDKGAGALPPSVPPCPLAGLKALSHCWEPKPEEIPSANPEIAHAAVGHDGDVNLLPVAAAATQFL